MDINEIITETYNKEIKFFSELSGMSHTEGGFSHNSLIELGILLYKNAKQNMSVCEIGSWVGFSTSILAKITKEFNGKFYAIDWFKGSPGSNLTPDRCISPKSIFEFNLNYLGLKDTVIIIDATSKEGNRHFENNCLDFIFIDADHRYEMIKQDIELWYPKLKKDGIICGHDCEYKVNNFNEILNLTEKIDFFQAHLGVIKAVSEKFPNYNLTETGNIWWVKK